MLALLIHIRQKLARAKVSLDSDRTVEWLGSAGLTIATKFIDFCITVVSFVADPKALKHDDMGLGAKEFLFYVISISVLLGLSGFYSEDIARIKPPGLSKFAEKVADFLFLSIFVACLSFSMFLIIRITAHPISRNETIDVSLYFLGFTILALNFVMYPVLVTFIYPNMGPFWLQGSLGLAFALLHDGLLIVPFWLIFRRAVHRYLGVPFSYLKSAIAYALFAVSSFFVLIVLMLPILFLAHLCLIGGFRYALGPTLPLLTLTRVMMSPGAASKLHGLLMAAIPQCGPKEPFRTDEGGPKLDDSDPQDESKPSK